MSFESLKIRWDLFWSTVVNPFYYDRILEGLQNTLIIAFSGFLIGFLFGGVLAVLKLLPQKYLINRILSKFCDIYVAIFRGTPMVVQLLVSFYLLFPMLGLVPVAMPVCIVMFGLNSAAYVCEIMRGGILSVDKGQMEAGRSLGLSYTKTMLKIVIPQAIKNILPTLGNELIILVKETSIVSFVGATDLYTAFSFIGNENYENVIPYLMMAVIYIVIVVILTLLIKFVERRLRASDKR